MEITKVVKPFIRRGGPNTFVNIVHVSDMFLTGFMRFIQNVLSALMSITLHF